MIKRKYRRKKCKLCEKMYKPDCSISDENGYCPKCQEEQDKITTYAIPFIVSIVIAVCIFISPDVDVLLKILLFVGTFILTELLYFKSEEKIETIKDTIDSKIICICKAISILAVPLYFTYYIMKEIYNIRDGIIAWISANGILLLNVALIIILLIVFFGGNHIIKMKLQEMKK
jgi:predicted neutral ceramidase superfamily lipid hydrolase